MMFAADIISKESRVLSAEITGIGTWSDTWDRMLDNGLKFQAYPVNF